MVCCRINNYPYEVGRFHAVLNGMIKAHTHLFWSSNHSELLCYSLCLSSNDIFNLSIYQLTVCECRNR